MAMQQSIMEFLKHWLIVVLLCPVLCTADETDSNNLSNILRNHEVVPDVISDAPTQLLKITYHNDLQVDIGLELTPTQVKEQPKVEWAAEKGSFYTLIMTDPDAPSRTDPKFREFNHWLVGNIFEQDINSGTTIRAYVGSGPPKDTGLHRYIFLLYKQPQRLDFEESHVSANSRVDRPKFHASVFAQKYQLGEPIAVNFFQAQFDDYVPILHKQLSGN